VDSFSRCGIVVYSSFSSSGLKCYFVVKRLVESIEPHLSRCPGLGGQQAVLERFLRHPSIPLHLPSYYLPPKEAAAQKLLVEGLRFDLDEVKGVQSKEKLAWKETILSAVVSKGNKESIVTQGQDRGSLKWAPLTCIKRSARIDEETTATVTQWWNQETRVSPVHKEVVRKRVGPKLYVK
jgi:hypothetical protein